MPTYSLSITYNRADFPTSQIQEFYVEHLPSLETCTRVLSGFRETGAIIYTVKMSVSQS